MKRYFLFLVASISLIAGCGSSETQTPSRTDTCDILTEFAKQFVDYAKRYRSEYQESSRNIAIAETPYKLLPKITPNGPIEGAITTTIPALADWRSITGLPERSVFDACEQLDPWASKEGVITDDDRIASLTTGADWDAHVLRIALPVFTNDGRHAVIFASKMFGGLDGVRIVAFYSKSEDGNWQLIGTEVHSVA